MKMAPMGTYITDMVIMLQVQLHTVKKITNLALSGN
jgi:hypothetical protein